MQKFIFCQTKRKFYEPILGYSAPLRNNALNCDRHFGAIQIKRDTFLALF